MAIRTRLQHARIDFVVGGHCSPFSRNAFMATRTVNNLFSNSTLICLNGIVLSLVVALIAHFKMCLLLDFNIFIFDLQKNHAIYLYIDGARGFVKFHDDSFQTGFWIHTKVFLCVEDYFLISRKYFYILSTSSLHLKQ